MLTFIAGDFGRAAGRRVASTTALAEFAAFLRRFHDAVRNDTPPPGADWALPANPDAPPTGICHGDFAPWNVVWSGDTPVGLLDFDLLRRRGLVTRWTSPESIARNHEIAAWLTSNQHVFQ